MQNSYPAQRTERHLSSSRLVLTSHPLEYAYPTWKKANNASSYLHPCLIDQNWLGSYQVKCPVYLRGQQFCHHSSYCTRAKLWKNGSSRHGLWRQGVRSLPLCLAPNWHINFLNTVHPAISYLLSRGARSIDLCFFFKG